MDLSTWIPSLTTAALFSGALWLARNLIATRLTRTVEHEFNTKIEAVRAQFRESEERLKADLRAREVELAALRSGALSALASRQAAIYQRQLEAVEQIWQSITSLNSARALAAQMAVIKFDKAAEYAERDSKARQFFEVIGAGFDPKSMDHATAAKARPFVTPMVWAAYIAIVAIASQAVMRWHVLKGGLGKSDFLDHEAVKKLITAVLPDRSDYLDKVGPDGYYYLLEALDTKLLEEMQSMLSGAESNKASVEQAAEIIRMADALNNAASQSIQVPAEKH